MLQIDMFVRLAAHPKYTSAGASGPCRGIMQLTSFMHLIQIVDTLPYGVLHRFT